MDDTTKAALEWLQKHGLPLEVNVGKLCRDRGWLTFHSHPYVDPRTSKTRACDIHATRLKRMYGQGTASIELVVECKRSVGKPWVIFAEPTKPHDWFLPSMLAVGRLSEVALMAMMSKPDPLDFLRPVDWVGYAVVKAHSSGKDSDPSAAHGALQSVMSAAEAFSLRNEKSLFEHPDWPPSIEITLPVLVIGAPLLLYSADGQGKEELTRITEAKVIAPERAYESRCLATVVTADTFDVWLDRLAGWADPLLERLAAKALGVRAMVEKHRQVEELLEPSQGRGA